MKPLVNQEAAGQTSAELTRWIPKRTYAVGQGRRSGFSSIGITGVLAGLPITVMSERRADPDPLPQDPARRGLFQIS